MGPPNAALSYKIHKPYSKVTLLTNASAPKVDERKTILYIWLLTGLD